MSALDVIIVGAGAAGLAAASELGRAGLSLCVLEARDRIGGRMFTKHDPESKARIELGAEFIHGLSAEIWEPLQGANIKPEEVEGDSWCSEGGRLSRCSFFSQVEEILEQVDDSEPDEPFLDFLNRKFGSREDMKEAREHAVRYVSGFNAADPALVGVHWLVKGMRAEEQNGGSRAFRCLSGYSELVGIFERELKLLNVPVYTDRLVESIAWQQGSCEVRGRAAAGEPFKIAASRVLLTLPLGVLKAPAGQTGSVEFLPSLPQEKIDAFSKIEMGKVIRIVLQFRQRFWETIRPPDEKASLSNMSFLFSPDEYFPTWWTTMPRKLPMITGWAPFRSAEELSGREPSEVVSQALQTLGKLLQVESSKLDSTIEAAHFHDWQADPFSRGAYSYGKVGANLAQQVLASPLMNTLFFAGEATDTTGNNGTVHGAIASGHRAAQEILHALK